jgi:hypothetical protein
MPCCPSTERELEWEGEEKGQEERLGRRKIGGKWQGMRGKGRG